MDAIASESFRQPCSTAQLALLHCGKTHKEHTHTHTHRHTRARIAFLRQQRSCQQRQHTTSVLLMSLTSPWLATTTRAQTECEHTQTQRHTLSVVLSALLHCCAVPRSSRAALRTAGGPPGLMSTPARDQLAFAAERNCTAATNNETK